MILQIDVKIGEKKMVRYLKNAKRKNTKNKKTGNTFAVYFREKKTRLLNQPSDRVCLID